MKLYHGTNAAHVPSIMKGGLKPRGKKAKGNWGHTITSRHDAIYLTNAYAPYFAMNSTGGERKGAIIEIDSERLNFLNLVPDEDALEQFTKRGIMSGKIPAKGEAPLEWSMEKRTRFYRDRLQNYAGMEQWKDSLKAMGNCAYLGPIPASAITRIAIIDVDKAPVLAINAIQPSITITNYRLVGDRYRGYIKWIFGDDLGEDAPRENFTDEQVMALAAEQGYSVESYAPMRYSYILPPESERAGIEIMEIKR